MVRWPRPAVLATAALAALVTLLVSVLSTLEFGYRSPGVHVAIETAASVVAIVVSALLLGRFRATRRLDDLVLFVAMLIFALANAAFSTTLALAGQDGEPFGLWAPLVARAAGALALACAAFAPARAVASTRRGVATGLALALLVGAVATLVGALGGRLGTGVDPNLSPAATDSPRIVGTPGVLALQLVAMAAYATAALGFLRRAERSGEELLAWVAIGATLAAFSRLNYFLFPSIFSNYVFVGDVLRLCSYSALLVGSVRAIGSYQRAAALAAVADERRRMARELHDGLAQELAFIAMQARRLAGRGDGLGEIERAAQRALAESRAAISVLAREGERDVAAEVAEAAETVAARAGARVQLALDPDVELTDQASFALARVVREAVTNAVRHGGAEQVEVRLDARDGVLRLVVADDGAGFDPAAPASRGGGFGLTSMRERAATLGGRLDVRSHPGRGTTVEMTIPSR